MRFRLVFAGVLAAAWAAAATASASVNPQHAGLQVALRAKGLYLDPIEAILGPKTEEAVGASQRGPGFTPGIADIGTRRQLGRSGRLFGSRTLLHRKFGWDVAVLNFCSQARCAVPVVRADESDRRRPPALSARDAPEGRRHRGPHFAALGG
jgi:hypothetical protein